MVKAVFIFGEEQDECLASVEGPAVSKMMERHLSSSLQLSRRMT